jgi:PPP family 3-phenylpropionic acid transporter
VSPVYFFLFGAIGAMTPFLSLHYRNAGLSGTELSILLSVTPVLLFISQPIFGPMTDRSGHRGRMLSLLFLALAGSGALLSLGSSFWTLLPLVVLWAFFAGPLVPIADSIALGEAQRTGVGYPQLRLWGSIGFVLTTTGLGKLYNLIDLRWAFAFYAALNLIAFGFARRLPPDGLSSKRPVWPALKAALRNPQLLGFLLCSALLQTTQAAHSSFFSIHVENLGGTKGMVGMAWGIAALTEVPVWLVLSRVTRRTGPLPLIAFSAGMYALRWFLYAIAPSAELILALQLLQGLSFAVFMPTAVLLINELVPADLRTSGQALLVMVNGGIATVVGNITSGYIVDMSSTAQLYRIAAYVALAAGAGFVLLVRRARQSVTEAV